MFLFKGLYIKPISTQARKAECNVTEILVIILPQATFVNEENSSGAMVRNATSQTVLTVTGMSCFNKICTRHNITASIGLSIYLIYLLNNKERIVGR